MNDPGSLLLDLGLGDRADEGDTRRSDAVVAWLQGRGAFPGPEVAGPLSHEGRRTEYAPRALSDEELADVAEDWLPDIAILGERITGDPYLPVTVPVAAALAALPGLCRGRSVIELWSHDRPEGATRQTLRVLAASPPGVWSDSRAIFRVVHPKPAPGEPTPPSPHGVGRPYLTREGWAWSGWIPFGCPIDPGALRRRLRAELRVDQPGQTVEGLLRAHAERVYRAACEGASRAEQDNRHTTSGTEPVSAASGRLR